MAYPPGGQVVITGMLIYSAICSLDGYTTDPEGKIDWAMPDDELLVAVNDQERGIGTYLYGGRMYETMRYWETADLEGHGQLDREFARTLSWRPSAASAAERSTCTTVRSGRRRAHRPPVRGSWYPDASRPASIAAPGSRQPRDRSGYGLLLIAGVR